MKRSFFRSDLRRGVIAVGSAALVISASAAIAGFFGYNYLEHAAIGLSTVTCGLLLFVLATYERKDETRESFELNVINKISEVCSEISKGNFDARITNINERGALAEAQHKVNDMIDRCDAFVREATASLEAVCRNIYYRRIFYGGMQGSFRVAAEIVNNSVKAQEKAVEKARLDAAAEQDRLINSLAQSLKSLAEGDLTYRLREFPEAYKQVRDDFNSAMTGLEETIKAIATAAREVSNATSEISAGTTDLSQRTEEQAASLEETSAAMEEISATVKKNAENAQAANVSASSTREVADRGGQVVAQAVEAMARIEASSRKISDIIVVIDEIARQTNLLALNAAVEAARAGESGRGFAVVATEVRSLAQRSSQAAKDIKDLIGNSTGQVKEGVELVNRAGTALHDVVESIKGVAGLVSEIAGASIEQSTGIEQINKALNQMDEVTQQNSALVEENAATAKTLEHQASAMADQVAFFCFDETSGSAATIGDDVDLDAAIEKHAAWKVTLRSAIADRARLDTATIAKDNCCQIGQWLHGAGKSKFGGKREFQSLVTLHKAFHVEAGKVSELINERRYAEAEHALNNGTSYAHASVSVRNAIVALKTVAAA
jgi:methyl-accepting chemotaxis protein